MQITVNDCSQTAIHRLKIGPTPTANSTMARRLSRRFVPGIVVLMPEDSAGLILFKPGQTHSSNFFAGGNGSPKLQNSSWEKSTIFGCVNAYYHSIDESAAFTLAQDA